LKYVEGIGNKNLKGIVPMGRTKKIWLSRVRNTVKIESEAAT
jgi:hypothetical protein